MRARDFRTAARWALRGNWGASVAATLVALLLGGWALGASLSNLVTYLVNGFPATVGSHYYGYSLFSALMAILGNVLVLSAFGQLVGLVLGGPVRLGLCQYNLRLVLRTDRPSVSALFFRFHIFGKAFLLQLVFTGLYTLLGLLPGLAAWLAVYAGLWPAPGGVPLWLSNLVSLACYALMVFIQLNYAMAPYLMSQDPGLGVAECLRMSRRMMRGNKRRLFCLQLSFAGWMCLSIFSCYVGLLWVMAYMAAAEAAFYLELTGQLAPMYWQPVYSQPPGPAPQG